MHIDHDGMVLQSESDVEQKLIMPLLTGAAYLDILESRIKTKEYLAPTEINRKAGQTSGHFPDYSVWFRSFPCLIVEAKSPEVSAEARQICQSGLRPQSARCTATRPSRLSQSSTLKG
jgi:hypothetical protein